MKQQLFLIIAYLSLCFTACNSNSESTQSEQKDKPLEVLKGNKSGFESPCELISVEEVRGFFSVPEDIDIEMEDKVYTHPTCSFEWQDGKVVSTMEAGGRQVELKKPSELMVVMVFPAKEFMYNTAIKVYKDIETVPDVGEMASWGNQMSQLTFFSGKYLFHVHVKASNDDAANRAKAMKVARFIMKQL